MNKKKIYKQIAKKHGISVKEVKREMEAAVKAAWANPGAETAAAPRSGDILPQ